MRRHVANTFAVIWTLLCLGALPLRCQPAAEPVVEWGPTHIWTLGTNGWKLIPLDGVQVAENGESATVRATQTLVVGAGLTAESLPGRITIYVDTAWLQHVLYRENEIPLGPGPCDPVKRDGVIAVDPRGYFYLCVPDPAGGYRRMRGVLQADW